MYYNQKYPQPAYPQGGIPQGGYPQAGYPKPDNPQAGYPSGQPAYAAASYPPQPGFQPGYEDHPNDSVLIGDEIHLKGFDFSDASIRRGFIRKVYAILMCQLLATLSVIALFAFHKPTKLWVHENGLVMLYVSLGIVFPVLIAMACCGELRRKAPTNMILLAVFTGGMSIMLGVTTSFYETEIILMAVGITAAICLALTLFAFQTKWDFTVMGAGLFVALVALFIFGIIAAIVQDKIMSILYSACGAILFSMYLVYDTQLMIGGKHKYSISPEEYIFAALNLYLDVINIFLKVLSLLRAAR